MNLSKFEITQNSEYTFFEKIKYTFCCFVSAYAIIVGIKLFSGIVDVILGAYGFLEIAKFQIQNFKFENKSNIYIIFNLLILAPIIEEIIFRLHLNLKNKMGILSLFTVILLALKYLLQSGFNLEFYFLMFYAIFLLSLFLLKNTIVQIDILNKVNLITSTVLFGVFHLLNFNTIRKENLIYFFINIIPMIVFGYFFSKIRIKFNIFWSIILHTMSNIIPCIILLN